ncbi:MAG: GWxTD domain-containing protein [Bacteroidales bacterium]|nr:GWxTD domain-containing protein [Bacteroidales bacterium]
MKRILFVAILITTLLSPAVMQSKTLQAYLNYTVFNVPGKGPFIETYLSVEGKSVFYMPNESGQFQGKIEVTFIFRQGEEIKEFDKYQLFSPVVSDTAAIDFSFIDQQRYFIPEGEYEMEIMIADLNTGKKPFSATQPVTINFDDKAACFSGVQFVKSFSPSSQQNILTKGGYDLVPLVYNFYPESTNKLIYYTEIYNSDKALGPGEKFLNVTMIRSFETENTLKEFVTYRKFDAGPVVPVFGEFDISRLPSGNFLLVFQVKNRQNEVIAENKMFFQRSNPNIQFSLDDLATIDVNATFASRITNADTLQEFINCLDPIATELEKNFIYKQAKLADLKTKQQFFYNFWSSRDMINPETAWKDYYGQVQVVNKAYKTQISKGYDTDRGRVYLKYGPPNIISENYNEPSSYPYEIWHYYELGGNQRNKKFVFYTQNIITNNFQLLHSDAIGEIQNYKWQVFLNNRWYDPYNVDANQAPGIYGGKADDYYRNPR